MEALTELDIISMLKDSGLRVTPQRIAVLSFMDTHRVHSTADEIYLSLKQEFPSLSAATVYNTLRAFMDAGIVKELRNGDHASRFDINTSTHHHFVCDRCGNMTDVELPEIPVERVAREHHFEVLDYHVEIRGICSACNSETMMH